LGKEADWVTKSPVRHKLYRVLLTKRASPRGDDPTARAFSDWEE